MQKGTPPRTLFKIARRGALPLALMTTACSSVMAQTEGPFFERAATYPVYHNLPEGADPAQETVAEIVAATADGMMLAYTDSPGERLGLVDISDISAPTGAGMVDLGGEPTSVSIVGTNAFVGVNTAESYTEPSGHVAVVDLNTSAVSARCDVGGQPDSLAVSADGGFLAVAVENERDEDLNDGVIPQLPAGTLAVFDLAGGTIANCDAARIVELTGLAEVAGEDPEPEYVDINAANIAAVSLQENNHIALVDLAAGTVTGHYSAGSVDLTAIDILEDDIVAGAGSLSGLAREPDAIAWLDDNRLFTANEGDYEGGSRGVSVFANDGSVLFDSGNSLEHLGMSAGHYPEGRAENKGVEPEGAEVGTFGDTTYAFALSERGNFVAIYADGGDGALELTQALPTGVGPEGVVAIPARDLLVVSAEVDAEEDSVRSSITLYTRTAGASPYPHIVSATDEATGAPIGWGALSGMVGDPADANIVYAVSDSAYALSRIYTIDTGQTPAVITAATDVTKNGEAVAYDLEGIAPAAGGGFWLSSEGNASRENPLQQRSMIIKVSADGAVESEIEFPEAAYEHATNRGFEGVAAWGEGDAEQVMVAVQSTWKDDPEGTTKLGIFSPANESWRFVHYPLAEAQSPRGGWVGLSEVTWLGDQRFAILERDNQPGDYAAIKTVTTIDLAGVEPAALDGDIPVVEKQLAIDLLPIMQATKGWISDKPEGIAITADGQVFMVSDNDALDDATGETQFLKLGEAGSLF